MSPCPMEKPNGTPLHACQGQNNVPCSPLSPMLSLLWRVLETSNGHHGETGSETGSETTWRSWGELWHCQPTGPRPVPACLQAAPVHQHPSEPGPLTCFTPDTWQQLCRRGAVLPRARHRAAGSWLERAQGFRTSMAPRPRGGTGPPYHQTCRSHPAPTPAWRGRYRWPHGYCPPRG